MRPCVVRPGPRLDPATLEALDGLGVATIHEAFAQRGLMLPAIRPIAKGQRICGQATTSLNHAGDNLMIHAAVDVSRPGDVLVVATTSPSEHGMVGELLATQARAKGIIGIILDAGVRDTAELRAMGFPVWARHVSAAATRKAAPGWVNVPTVCGGITVHPGDVVVADDDGVVVIPLAALTQVAEAARAREVREVTLRRRYAAGESSLDVNDLRRVLVDLGVTYCDADDRRVEEDRPDGR